LGGITNILRQRDEFRKIDAKERKKDGEEQIEIVEVDEQENSRDYFKTCCDCDEAQLD
jgi:hypothetical protein